MPRHIPAWVHRTFTKDSKPPAHGKVTPLTAGGVLTAWLGAFFGIGSLAIVITYFPELELLIIGSFGASAVLLYAAPQAPFSQPRNLIGGHLISALTGVACFKYLPDYLVLQEAAAVATAIALMMVTRTIHPPGGATALIAVIGSEHVHGLGWGYAFMVMLGAFVMLVVALVSNNLYRVGSYPERWD